MEFFSGAFGANYLGNPYIMAKIANFFLRLRRQLLRKTLYNGENVFCQQLLRNSLINAGNRQDFFENQILSQKMLKTKFKNQNKNKKTWTAIRPADHD